MALLQLDNACLSFGHVALLDSTKLILNERERVALVGRNGAGKSSVLKVLSGEYELDDGSYWKTDNLTIAYLEQDLIKDKEKSVFEVVSDGLPEVGNILYEYHQAVVTVSTSQEQSDLDNLARLQSKLESVNGWHFEQQIESIISKLELSADDKIADMSGGQKRRVFLAKALVGEPDVLMLDEPTNHLDIPSILWLENFLLNLNSSLLFITHDRSFLSNLATRIIDLDRGELISYPGNYSAYLELKEKQLEEQLKQNALFDKKLNDEEKWIRQGIKARRTRNEGRVRALEALRVERSKRREKQGNVKFSLDTADRSGKLVVELEKVNFSFENNCMVKDLSLRIMRGDRIGIIGPNGIGKSTLLKLLLGELKPDQGNIRLGTKLEVAYFDQHREQLNLEASVFDNVNNGQEYVEIQGQSRHVIGYLQDFLFSPERVRSPVKTLSGGERNRLLIARLFTQAANFLILDEPTNDLDIETLELLESLLLNYQGTILVVSHDRQFLDNIVTGTLVLSGNGVITEFVGGYGDYIRQLRNTKSNNSDKKPTNSQKIVNTNSIKANKKTNENNNKAKLSYKEQHELKEITAKIEKLEQRQRILQNKLNDPEFYEQDGTEIAKVQLDMKNLSKELDETFLRWEQLESI
ncbi:Bis-ABC ATPase Uup [hydrothermal vent metagenome]|uniref:Bis-ABC ATPase Uup n=1 Tax=hydrothermal vent metagenome TaxID=652676 RepID=A0A3B1A3Z1_9ZZZZ